MATSFSALKNNRKSSFEDLTSKLTKLNQPSYENSSSDDRFWKPDVDKAGNGYAIIRFLPAPAGEDDHFVRLWNHGFQGPGGWYIENSLTTIGKPDPVSENNQILWNSGLEENKNIVSKHRKRRLHHYSNILVVKDPTRPENEGKVFIFKYGKKIFDKINEAMFPEFPDEKPMNPFDMWEGANFVLKVRKVEGFPNYDKSEFASIEPISNDDEKIEKIWNKCHSLQEIIDPKNFKSYEELKTRFLRVIGDAPATSDEDNEVAPEPSYKQAPAVQQKTAAPKPMAQSKPWDEEDDEDLSFFKKLAKDD
jgi:hypothetical protein